MVIAPPRISCVCYAYNDTETMQSSSSSAASYNLAAPTSLGFGDPVKLTNGQMIIPVSIVPGTFSWDTRLVCQFGKHQGALLTSQYGLSKPQANGDPNRLNLDFTPDSELEAWGRELDRVVVDYCSKNSQTLFKTATLNKQYCPLVQEKDKAGTVIRVKVVAGADEQRKLTEVKVFNDACTELHKSTCESLKTRNLAIMTLVSTQGIWYTGSQFGVSFKADTILCKRVDQATGIARFNLLPGVTEVQPPDAVSVARDVMEE